MSTTRSLAILCFFLSGFSGLVYEVVWIRKASLVFGSTTLAMSTVIAVFFAGLALGSWRWGRIGQRVARPIRLYAVLELAIAVLAAFSLALFGLIEGWFGTWYSGSLTDVAGPDGTTWLRPGPGLIGWRVLLVSLVILPPTFLMGGTLPLFCRQFVLSRDRITGSIGGLYGINTLGGMAGVLATGFWLMPTLGMQKTLFLAAAVSAAAGLISLALRFEPFGAPAKAEDDEVAATKPMARASILVPTLFLGAGFVSVALQVFWARFLTLVIRNSVTTYTITLTVVLAGIVLGSWVSGWLADRKVRSGGVLASWFGVCLIGSSLAVVVLVFLPAWFWQGLGQGIAPFFLLMLPSAALSGAAFPLANRLVLADPANSSRSVGRMTALNTVGGILGSLAAGFALLPGLGLDIGIRIVTLAGLVLGGTAWLALGHRSRRFSRLPVAAVAFSLLAWGLWPAVVNTGLPGSYLAGQGVLLDHEEGLGSTLATVELEGAVRLEIDRMWQGENRKGHQIMAAHIPAILHGHSESVLVVGVGVGQTAGRFLMHEIQRLDCVDIEPRIFDFVARNFDSKWMNDPRVRLIAEDGRTYVAHTGEIYDIVSLEIGQIFRPGVDAFYTKEFYRDVYEILGQGGIVAQFVPLGFLGPHEFHSVIRTFLEVFPRSSLWYNTQELLLVGRKTQDPIFDFKDLESLSPDVKADLAWSHWGGPTWYLDQPGAFLGSFLLDKLRLATLAADGDIYTDDRPDLAYAASRVDLADHLEEPLARELVNGLAPFSMALLYEPDRPEVAFAEKVRQLNLRDIVASGLLARATAAQQSATPQQTMAVLKKALEWNPQSFLASAGMGKALLKSGQAQEAEKYLSRALAMQPDDPLVGRDLGLVYVTTGRPDQALPLLRGATDSLPYDAAAFNYLGTALAMTGDAAGAVAAFERSLELDPDDRSAQQNLDRARSGSTGN